MSLFYRVLKFWDEFLIVVGLIIVAAILYVVWVTRSAETVGELMHEGARKNISAVQATKTPEGEVLAPIASYTEYRRCGSGVFSARLAGEPLACSASNFTDRLLMDPGEPGQTFYRQFGAACNRHDLCYIHGDTTYGYSRDDCDRAFLADTLKTCKLIYWNKAPKGIFGIAKPFNYRRYCEFRAAIGYSAVNLFGGQFFYKNYSPVCDYESGPHAVRDHIVSGKFLAGDNRDYFVSIRLMKDLDSIKVTLSRLNADGESEEVTTDVSKIVAADVPVLDREWACQQTGRSDFYCPEDFRLGITLVTARDWLRFNPIVVDHDGDGKQEIVLVSVTQDYGLGFTHLRFSDSGDTVSLSAEAYLGADRIIERDDRNSCEWGLEFANCFGTLKHSEAYAQKAARRYAKAVEKRSAAREILEASDPESDLDKIDQAKKDIADANKVIKETSAFRDPKTTENIRSWRAEAKDVGKKEMRKEDYFVLSIDGVNQKTSYQFVPLRVRNSDDSGWRYDLAMMSAHAFDDQNNKEDAGHAFRRFSFDQDLGRWTMTRDLFARDGHLVSKCTFEEDEVLDRFDQYRRYQYRAFPLRLHGFGNDRLATFQREKCPTSAINPAAGSLGDVDVMVYMLDEAYDEKNDFVDRADKIASKTLKAAYTSWFPLIWSEAAHPLISSEAARARKIHMVGTHIGGAAQITYPVVAVLRDSQDLHTRMLRAEERRLPDTYGKLADRYYLKWDKNKFGYPESYFELPSVLSTFGTDGEKGLSLVYFNNRKTAEKKESEGAEPVTEEAKPEKGKFRALIVPIPGALDREFKDAKLLDCPVGAVTRHKRKRFSARYRDAGGKRSGRRKASFHRMSQWQEHFLRHEPMLSGNFLQGGRGALASAWRDRRGDIGVTALYHDGNGWRFGAQSCSEVARISVDRLY